MNIYEDKYLYRRINQIIAKQKEGKILLASYNDGSGLPSKEEISQELTRAAYPYDYIYGKYGFLKLDSELGVYEFTPKPGGKLPPVLANYRILTLAEAFLDIQKRRIIIKVDEKKYTFTNIQIWKGMYEIQRDINEELAKNSSGIVVWKIIPRESNSRDLIQSLFPEAVPKVRNGQALAHVSGYAYDEDFTLAYIGLVGYKTSLESLRVTLMSRKTLQMEREDERDIRLVPTDRYENVWLAMPEYTSHNAALIARQALPGKWEPEDFFSYLLVFHGTQDPEAEMIRLFLERIKEALEIPILDDWAPVLWQYAREKKLVQDLKTAGDCIRGARIDLRREEEDTHSNWQELFSELLEQKEISVTI